MRTPAQWLALALLVVCACSSDDNYVVSGGSVIISPVRSSLSAVMSFKDQNNVPHQQWVIVMTDTDGVCTKLATNPNYFQTPIESFDAVIIWVPPGKLGTWIPGQVDTSGSIAGHEILVGQALADGGSPQRTQLPRVDGVGTIALGQFDVGGEAAGTFDVGVVEGGRAREYFGKFKTSYCRAMENAILP